MKKKILSAFYKLTKRMAITQNANIDSMRVDYILNEVISLENLGIRYVFSEDYKNNLDVLKQYGLACICYNYKSVSPSDVLDGEFLVCLDSYSGGDKKLFTVLNTKNYLKVQGKKVVLYDGLTLASLRQLEQEFPDISLYSKVSVQFNIGKHQLIPNQLARALDNRTLDLVGVGTNILFINDPKLLLLPCNNQFRFAYLHTIFNINKRYYINERVRVIQRENNQSFIVKHKYAMLIHCYYLDLVDEVVTYLNKYQGQFDFFISLPLTVPDIVVEQLLAASKNIYLLIVDENIGRDIYPLLKILPKLDSYEWVLKLHTKKSLHRDDGSLLRINLWSSLIDIRPDELLPIYGIAAPKEHVIEFNSKLSHMALNYKNVETLLRRMKVTQYRNSEFIAGSMFWFRPDAIKQINSLKLNASNFPFECGQNDGEIQHAIERTFCSLSKFNKYQLYSF